MKTRESQSARPQPLPSQGAAHLYLTAFAAAALFCLAALAARGQSPAANGALPHPSAALKLAAGTTAPGQARAANASAKRGGGQHEGVTVRGWWVIEVKNPDGKVAARREFENAIQPSGMTYLASLLSGNNSPGALSIVLNGAASTYTSTNNPSQEVTIQFLPTSGPCAGGGQQYLSAVEANNWLVEFGQYGIPGGPCVIAPPANSGGNSGILTAVCNNFFTAPTASDPNPPNQCSTNLAVTGPTASYTNDGNSLAASFSLTGSVLVTAKSPGNITDVETVFESCTGSTSPAGCATQTSSGVAVGAGLMSVNLFTERNLDGQNGDPSEVPYSPGQSISATVTFSFR